MNLLTRVVINARKPRSGRQSMACRLPILPLLAGLLLWAGVASAAETAQLPGSLGLFDIASPILYWIDGTVFGWLPIWARVVLWSAVASFLSMGIYRLISRQEALDEVKTQVVDTRTQLQGFDGEFKDLWPILKQNLGLAGRQLWLTFVPAMLASLPVLFVLAWMANAFDATVPPAGSSVPVAVTAADGQALPPLAWRGDGKAVETAPGAWEISWPAEGGTMALDNADGSPVLTLPTAAPVRSVGQWVWWNRLIGNPGGYLSDSGDIAAVHVGLPQPTVFPFGPDWLRGWLPAMLVVLMGLSLFLKFHWRLH